MEFVFFRRDAVYRDIIRGCRLYQQTKAMEQPSTHLITPSGSWLFTQLRTCPVASDIAKGNFSLRNSLELIAELIWNSKHEPCTPMGICIGICIVARGNAICANYMLRAVWPTNIIHWAQQLQTLLIVIPNASWCNGQTANLWLEIWADCTTST